MAYSILTSEDSLYGVNETKATNNYPTSKQTSKHDRKQSYIIIHFQLCQRWKAMN